jgi:hypothetical protein
MGSGYLCSVAACLFVCLFVNTFFFFAYGLATEYQVLICEWFLWPYVARGLGFTAM